MIKKSRLNKLVEIGFFVFVCLFSQSATAEDKNCWEVAGTKYGVDPWLLYTIAQVESNLNPNAIGDNGDSRDLGLMQVNTWWIPRLVIYGIREDDLFHSCTNIDVGAWILSQSLALYSDEWDGIGAYNAGTGKTDDVVKERQAYAAKVYKQYMVNINNLK